MSRTISIIRRNNGNNWKSRKLDLPTFNIDLGKKDKVEAAVVYFEGEAMLWYQWQIKRTPLET